MKIIRTLTVLVATLSVSSAADPGTSVANPANPYNAMLVKLNDIDQRLRNLESMPEIRHLLHLRGNLLQLDAAVQVYCFENKTLDCRMSDLVGSDKLIRSLISIDGESYDGLRLGLMEPEWKVTSAHGLSVTLVRHLPTAKQIVGFKKQPDQPPAPTSDAKP